MFGCANLCFVVPQLSFGVGVGQHAKPLTDFVQAHWSLVKPQIPPTYFVWEINVPLDVGCGPGELEDIGVPTRLQTKFINFKNDHLYPPFLLEKSLFFRAACQVSKVISSFLRGNSREVPDSLRWNSQKNGESNSSKYCLVPWFHTYLSLSPSGLLIPTVLWGVSPSTTMMCNVNPGWINHGLSTTGYSPDSDNMILKWYPP